MNSQGCKHPPVFETGAIPDYATSPSTVILSGQGQYKFHEESQTLRSFAKITLVLFAQDDKRLNTKTYLLLKTQL